MGWEVVRRCVYKNFSLVLCCEGFLSVLSPSRSTTRRSASKCVQCRVPVSGRSVTHLHSPFDSPCRTFTFTSCDSRPCSRASMSLLDPRRFRELMLPYCLLSWARQLAPIYLMCMTTQEFFMSPV